MYQKLNVNKKNSKIKQAYTLFWDFPKNLKQMSFKCFQKPNVNRNDSKMKQSYTLFLDFSKNLKQMSLNCFRDQM